MSSISVILPVFNGVDMLPAAIDSILDQSYKEIELLVVNDGSTEDIDSVMKIYSDSRIRYFSRENRGLGQTLNEMIDLASFEYIARMDADDVSLPGRLNAQLTFLERNPEVIMVGGQIEFLAGYKKIKTFPMPLNHHEIKAGLLGARFPICHPAIMFRKSFAEKIGKYRINGAGEDLDFFIRMSEVGAVANIPDRVLSYRIHKNSLSTRKQVELNRGYAYAIYNAKQRSNSLSELSPSEFYNSVWVRRGMIEKLFEYIHNFSERLYRNSIIFKSDGLKVKSFIYLTLAALLRPKTTIRRVFKILTFDQSHEL